MQRREAVAEPPGECRSELWILDRLCRELKRRYAAGGVFAAPIVELRWDYGDVPSAQRVAEEIPALPEPTERACLFAPSLDDGPLPEHYEPLESPVANLLSPQQHSPLVMLPPDQVGTAEAYPIVATTFGVAEHWQTGSATRNVPWLVELVPNAFAGEPRVGPAKGIATGDLMRSVPRGQITLHALVTGRLNRSTSPAAGSNRSRSSTSSATKAATPFRPPPDLPRLRPSRRPGSESLLCDVCREHSGAWGGGVGRGAWPSWCRDSSTRYTVSSEWHQEASNAAIVKRFIRESARLR